MTENLLETDDLDLLNDEDLFIIPKKKRKILMLSDHPLCTSGVGVQARMLIDGLVKTGKYTFRCLGGAIRHENYNTIGVNEDFVIKPVDGFGTKEMIRELLMRERPDAIIIFTDPRQFIWLWEMEDEIHQVCPIAYWHVWDNDPYPKFNESFYESTDLINCLSHKTYELVKPNFPEENRVNYIPHAFPKEIYHPIDPVMAMQARRQHLGVRADWFVGLWVNRNATRKLPSDVLETFKDFLDDLEAAEGHRNAMIIMHTDPTDPEGPNLMQVTEMLGIRDNVLFSPGKLEFQDMNILHNMCDFTVNIAKAEGFGLTNLASLMMGKPQIGLKTGGMTRQLVDWRDGSPNGFPIEPAVRMLVGSQLVPYIYDDHVDKKAVTEAYMKIYKMTSGEKQKLAKKMMDYADFEFNYGNVIKQWDESLEKCITDFKEGNRAVSRFEIVTLEGGKK
jgi:glycosyltransferase involved in cell wall biosynthesis